MANDTKATSKDITLFMNSTIDSVKSVIPMPLQVEKPLLIHEPLIQAEIGVLIGMTGDIIGRLVIEGTNKSMGEIGQTMFGMPLEGEMLESFTGELANMIAGNIATSISQHQVSIDITPPTVIVGTTKLYGFKQAFTIPINYNQELFLQLILIIEE